VLLRQRARNELREIEAVASHHSRRHAVVPLLEEEPVGIDRLLAMTAHIKNGDLP
jgi:arsenite-transporting ATPase